MFAIVESGSITSMPNGNKGITIGDNQYPASIYTLWSESERNAIGIYTIEIDETNKKIMSGTLILISLMLTIVVLIK